MNNIAFSNKFKPLFNTPKNVRYFIITGGRFSFKSFTTSTAVCAKVYNENRKALYTRYTLTSAKDSIIPEFQEKLEMLNISSIYDEKQDRVISKNNGEVVFKGIKTSSGTQTAKLKSLKGFSIFVLDEAEEENDEASFDKINLSIRQPLQNIVILILNPTTKEHWIYKRFFEDRGVEAGSNIIKDNACYIHTSYLDGLQHVPPDYLREIEMLKKSNPEKYNHIILGGWLDRAEGVVFTSWSYGEFNETLPFGYGQDFGFFPDPDVVVKVAIDKKQKKIYVKKALRMHSAGVDDLALNMRLNIDTSKVVYADSAEKRLISDLKIRGVKNIVGVKKWAGSIIEGIKLMQGYKIIVSPCSTEIASELNNYVWNNKKSGVPIDRYNHFIDAIRYYVQSTVRPFERKGMRAINI